MCTVMQYGFVTLFVPAFPLAPLFALVNNIFEMRLDAAKFLKNYRRPVPTRAPNIGVWFKILDILGRLAVISNVLLLLSNTLSFFCCLSMSVCFVRNISRIGLVLTCKFSYLDKLCYLFKKKCL